MICRSAKNVSLCGSEATFKTLGFEQRVLSKAYDLEVNGFVRNEPDGSVLMDIDAPPDVAKVLIGRIESAMSRNIEDQTINEHESLNRTNGFHVTG